MNHPSFVWLVASACIGIGSLIGGAGVNSGWMDDCKTIGLHRSGDIVYTCEVRK
jgi:hypothetical protein